MFSFVHSAHKKIKQGTIRISEMIIEANKQRHYNMNKTSIQIIPISYGDVSIVVFELAA